MQHPRNQVGWGRAEADGRSSSFRGPPPSRQPMVAIQVVGAPCTIRHLLATSSVQPQLPPSSRLDSAHVPAVGADGVGLRGSRGLDSADVPTGICLRRPAVKLPRGPPWPRLSLVSRHTHPVTDTDSFPQDVTNGESPEPSPGLARQGGARDPISPAGLAGIKGLVGLLEAGIDAHGTVEHRDAEGERDGLGDARRFGRRASAVARSRSATSQAVTRSVSGSSSRNSSPPQRATASWPRSPSPNTAATARSTPVAGVVAEVVVDALEVIDVGHDQG